MAQKYYNVKEAAEVLRVSEHEVKQMLDRRELHAYRDGADWKFKAEEIDAKAQQSPPPDEDDVLLSELELGQSDAGASGTVIGMNGGMNGGMDGGGEAPPGSDVKADSDIHLADQPEAAATAKQEEVDSKVSQFEELDLTLEEDLTLEDSQVGPPPASPGGDSTVDLTGKDLDDDDLVLGGSGAGSDVTIGADSGISLVDPADSGLSLEEPLDLTGSGSLELGEDDMLGLGAGAGAEAQTEPQTDDDFLLTPLEEVGEGEDSESGSQVIALDTEGEGDEGATVLGSAAAASSMAAMLEEELSTEPVLDMETGQPMPGIAPAGAGPGTFDEDASLTPSEAVLPETPYSIGVVLGQVACIIFLILCGMMMYDLLRNMWSWDAPYTVNSTLMDEILGWFE